MSAEELVHAAEGPGHTILSFSHLTLSLSLLLVGRSGQLVKLCFQLRDRVGSYRPRAQSETGRWFREGAKGESQYLLRLMRCVRSCCDCEEPPARCRVLGSNGGNCGAGNGSPPTLSGESSSRQRLTNVTATKYMAPLECILSVKG